MRQQDLAYAMMFVLSDAITHIVRFSHSHIKNYSHNLVLPKQF